MQPVLLFCIVFNQDAIIQINSYSNSQRFSNFQFYYLGYEKTTTLCVWKFSTDCVSQQKFVTYLFAIKDEEFYVSMSQS